MTLLPFLLACTGKGGDSVPDDTTPTTTDSVPEDPFKLYSPDFTSSAGDPRASECDNLLAEQFSCGGPNPELRWEEAPTDTRAFALIFDDPDASDFPHWAIYNIPLTEDHLGRAISGESGVTDTLPEGALQLENGHGSVGYYGSCPPAEHLYRWRLWALREEIDDEPKGSTAKEQFAWLEAEATDKAYAMAETCHLYGP
jgi:Raf kinase inhibitor-like YbhB/YbcL family protein